jgi:hypothetical protein
VAGHVDLGPHAGEQLMRILRSLVLLALVMTPGALLAQGNPVSNAVRSAAHDSGKNLLTAARAMPADKFGYKPTPAQMTFGELPRRLAGTAPSLERRSAHGV